MYTQSTGSLSPYTRKRHVLCPDTVAALAAAKIGKTWRGLAATLGYSEAYAATLHKVARGEDGSLTAESEDILRARLGLAQRPLRPGKPRSRKRYLHMRFDADEVEIRRACVALRDALRAERGAHGR